MNRKYAKCSTQIGKAIRPYIDGNRLGTGSQQSRPPFPEMGVLAPAVFSVTDVIGLNAEQGPDLSHFRTRQCDGGSAAIHVISQHANC